MKNHSANFKPAFPINLAQIKPLAQELYPHCPRNFVDTVASDYRAQLDAYCEFPTLSDEFIAVCLWIYHASCAIPRSKQIFQEFMSRMLLEASDIDNQKTSVKAETLCHHRPLVRRLANALFIGFNVKMDNSLVVALGSGAEKSNFEAVIAWVEKTLVAHDLPAQDSIIHELIPKFEQTLNEWSIQRFNC